MVKLRLQVGCPGLKIGGDEDKRRSQDHGGRRSFAVDAEEKVRAGVAELMKKTKMHQPSLLRKPSSFR